MNGLKKRPEYKKISASLQPNEEVRAYGVAYIGSTDHTVVVTNSRILIVAEKLFTKHFDSIPFGNVQSLNLKKGMSGTFLTINNIKLRFRKQKEAENIYNMLTVGEDTDENSVEPTPTDKLVKKSKNNNPNIPVPLVVIGFIAVFAIIGWIKSKEDKETIAEPVKQKIVDVIVIDQAKYDEALANKNKPTEAFKKESINLNKEDFKSQWIFKANEVALSCLNGIVTIYDYEKDKEYPLTPVDIQTRKVLFIEKSAQPILIKGAKTDEIIQQGKNLCKGEVKGVLPDISDKRMIMLAENRIINQLIDPLSFKTIAHDIKKDENNIYVTVKYTSKDNGRAVNGKTTVVFDYWASFVEFKI